jgi:hypothetical protein
MLESTSAESRVARVTIHHGPRYRSILILPLLANQAMLSGVK